MPFREPAYRVDINGTDYTDRFKPLVKNIEVTDKDGLTSDTCSITLADVDGQIAMPKGGDKMQVHLGHVGQGIGLVFSGTIDEVRSTGTRGGGRELRISAKGVDAAGKAKEPQQKHKDDATFGDVAKEWAKEAGLEAVISENLASIKDDYWAMQGESFIAWGQRVAREIGATFKIQDGKAMFVETNGGKSASGKDLPTINATWGDNLLQWDVSPVLLRPRHKTVRVEFYDSKRAKIRTKDVEVDSDGTSAEFQTRIQAPDEKNAERRAQAGKKRVERNSGEGSVTILGTADAKPEGNCIISGARPGVDGTYRIEGVKHTLSKRSGYTVQLDLKQPQNDAGKDSRTKTGSARSNSSNVEAGSVPSSNIG
ncbi:phage late control D family protein [Microvirga brassicacearum]|uniref:Late control protein n=1 Tax=Microvirga brassicacearum TaxID=2580413 RepID=A0A5N3PH75_9HYPH|nr:late control protein [Microvirga brassicacearum]KAB0269077.1 late control protein [Microvirga brassicacearum]